MNKRATREPRLQRWAADARTGLVGVQAWAGEQARALAGHPVRLAWTLLVTAAYLAALHPLLHYDHAFWWHAKSWFHANYQVDYGEGPMLNQEILLYHGINIYRLDNAPPFIVGNYGPVFPLVASLFMHVYGQTYTAGRLVSSLSIVGSAVVIALIVLQTTRQIVPALLAGGLLPTFTGIYSWGPFNRVDSLALFLSLCTVLVVVRYAGTRKVWWAVPLAVLTVYTRQSLVDGVFAAYLYLLVRDWRRGLGVGLATAASIGAVFVGLQLWSHGGFYVNAVIDNENAWNWGSVLGNWHGWMNSSGGRFVFRLGLAGSVAGLFGTGGLLWPVWLAASAGVFATIGKVGAAINYFFPVYAASAVCLGVFVARFRGWFRRAPFFVWPLELLLPGMLFLYIHGTPPRWLARLPLAHSALALVGPYRLTRAQVAHVGPRGDLAPVNPGNVQMIHFLRGIHGPVLSLDFPAGVQVQAGHQLQWQPFELGTVHADGHWGGQAFVRSISARYYAAIFFRRLSGVDNYVHGALAEEILLAVEGNYAPAAQVAGYQVWEPTAGPHVLLAATAPRALPRPAGVRLSHHEPRARTLGAWHEVPLYRWLNDQAVINPGRPAVAGQSFDGDGNAFSAALFPPAGTLVVRAAGTRVPFLLPRTGTGLVSSLRLETGAVIPLPKMPAQAVWLLEAGVNGPQRVGLTLGYAHGSPQRLHVPFTDWCQQPSPPQYPAYHAPFRLDAQAARTGPPCGLFALRVPLGGAHALRSVTLAPDANAQVLALTVQG